MLTVGEYYQQCGFRLERWNGKAVKVLTKLGDAGSTALVFGEIEHSGLKPMLSIKSLKYKVEARFGKDTVTVKSWESGLPTQKSMCEFFPLSLCFGGFNH